MNQNQQLPPSSQQFALVFTKDPHQQVHVSICTYFTSEKEIREKYSDPSGVEVIAIEFHSVFSCHAYFGKIFYELLNLGSSYGADHFRQLIEKLLTLLAERTKQYVCFNREILPCDSLSLYILLLRSDANGSFQPILTTLSTKQAAFEEEEIFAKENFSPAFLASFSLDQNGLMTDEDLSEADRDELQNAFDLFLALCKPPNGKKFRYLIEYVCAVVVNTIKKIFEPEKV